MIAEHKRCFDEITDFFDRSVYDRLEIEMRKIIIVFEEIFKNDSDKFELKSENPVYESKFYNIIGRVKSKTSFREKLVRKNLGLELINKLHITEANLEVKKAEIEQKINKFDDIIGLRIVCDLKKDCPKALKLIKENLNILENQKIAFNIGEIESQPQTMKNGLHIYRLKAEYDNRICFELQIKSKIEEAWGELDHFILYKDFSFFPSKDSVQNTMNNVGKLLDEIEGLLFDLRDSRVTYEQNVHYSEFISKLENAINKTLKNQLGVTYQIDKIGMFLFHLINREFPQFIESEQVLDFSFFSNTKEIDLNYLTSRNSSFEIQIIESIYSSIWIKKGNSLSEYSTMVNNLVGFYRNYINSYLDEISFTDILSHEKFSKIQNKLILSGANAEIWFSLKKYSELVEEVKMISEIITLLLDKNAFELEIITDENLESLIEEFTLIFGALHFESNLLEILSNLAIENNTLKLIVLKIRDYCSEHIIINVKDKQIKEFKRKLDIIDKTLRNGNKNY